VGMWEEEQICPVCRRASRYGLRHKYCSKPWTMEGLTCLWAYEGITRKLVTKSKYKGYFDYLREFTMHNEQFINGPEMAYFWEFLKQRPVLVPVPLHPVREKKRGFNQAEIIARIVGKEWGLDISNLLVRTKDTGREERLKEMEGAFKTSPSIPLLNLGEGRVLLVDDVWTTGATMSECAKVLRQAGVRQVWGWVLAR
jgi:ComF family protein